MGAALLRPDGHTFVYITINRIPHLTTRLPPIPLPRKILCALALIALALTTGAGVASAKAPSGAVTAPTGQRQRLLRADVFQAGRELVFTVRTKVPVALSGLTAHPDARRPASRYLCFGLRRAGGRGETRLCLGGRHARDRLGRELVDSRGAPSRKDAVAATVKRPAANKLVVSLEPAAAGLRPHRYSWRAIASNGCRGRTSCADSLPRKGRTPFRLRPVRAVGCTGGSAGVSSNGPRGRKVVALTFDDGPSDYTLDFLRVLREKHVHGTFFEVGDVMPGREATMRKILAEGNEIGDHTMSHAELPGYSQIAGAAHRIEEYTHFKPCLFRPPGGALDSSVISTAGSLGMRTVTWDVDPRDWSTPGTGAIYSNIVEHTQPGSIILMHDGGGPRGETLEALPQVIDTLRARGYRFATVTQLLGYRMLYQPYG